MICRFWCKWRRPVGRAPGLLEGRAAASELECTEGLFRRRHFNRNVIILCVRGDPRYNLGFRGSVGTISEPGPQFAYAAVLRSPQRFVSAFIICRKASGGRIARHDHNSSVGSPAHRQSLTLLRLFGPVGAIVGAGAPSSNRRNKSGGKTRAACHISDCHSKSRILR